MTVYERSGFATRGGEALRRRRWYERQDAIKKREPGKELPDFFNITLERPAEDAAGYDTLFVEVGKGGKGKREGKREGGV